MTKRLSVSDTFRRTTLATLFTLSALAAGAAHAGGHYVAGVEGIQAASVPPPGTYYLGYLVDYRSDSVRAPGGSTELPGDNRIQVRALANRFAWISTNKVLGADYGVELIVPVLRTKLDLGAVPLADSRSGIGDVYLGPLVLGWHGANWDAVAAAGLWLDSASTAHPASPGKGYKSTMLTAGGTYYVDEARSLSGSVLMRYEINGKTDTGFRPGRQISVEWGFGKGVGPVTLGVVGYHQQQVGNDSGPGASSDKSSRSAVGVEVFYPILSAGLFLKGAYYKEYHAEAGTGAEPKGGLLRFTLVKAF